MPENLTITARVWNGTKLELQQFELLSTLLGKGSWSSVHLGKNLNTGDQVAIKMFDKSNIKNSEGALREATILQSVKHPNIVSFFSVVEDSRYFYIIEELVTGGTMYSFMRSMKRLTEDQAGIFFSQIVSAVDYCHRIHSLCHRDLKLENILLDRNLNVKLIDFNLSQYVNPGQNLTKYVGSPIYASPEVLRRVPYDAEKADVWSLGCILFVFLCGKFPFFSRCLNTLASMILYQQLTIPSNISQRMSFLLTKMLDKDPRNRPTIHDLVQFDWTNYIELRREETMTQFESSSSVYTETVQTEEVLYKNSYYKNCNESSVTVTVTLCEKDPCDKSVYNESNNLMSTNYQEITNNRNETICQEVVGNTFTKSNTKTTLPPVRPTTLSQLPSFLSNLLLSKSCLVKQETTSNRGNDRNKQSPRISCSRSMVLSNKTRPQNSLVKSSET